MGWIGRLAYAAVLTGGLVTTNLLAEKASALSRAPLSYGPQVAEKIQRDKNALLMFSTSDQEGLVETIFRDPESLKPKQRDLLEAVALLSTDEPGNLYAGQQEARRVALRMALNKSKSNPFGVDLEVYNTFMSAQEKHLVLLRQAQVEKFERAAYATSNFCYTLIMGALGFMGGVAGGVASMAATRRRRRE